MMSHFKGALRFAAHLLFAGSFAAWAGGGAAAPAQTDLVLQGAVSGKDHQSYKLVPFEVPAGTTRLVVDFDYEGRDRRTVIDLGIMDPDGIRGWSGGNKHSFTIGAHDATPSYRPGPLPAGTWNLLLGIPNVRRGVTSRFTARVRLIAGERAGVLLPPTAGRGAGWYRGDFHMHSGHSDGSCASQTGRNVPCPLYKTLEAAAARKLDFVAVTEHNTLSHLQPLRELEPYFDKLLVIPGMEVTTFAGHANIFGVTGPVDFRAVTERPGGINELARQVRAAGGLVSINHPGLPSGEACMGCGWVAAGTDFALIDAVEVVNGGSLAAVGGDIESPISGLPFWQEQLHAGRRLVAIGGSDNHRADLDADQHAAVGRPTTVVHARDLTVPAILDGVRSGRAFIDTEGTGNRMLDVTASTAGRSASMGGAITARAGAAVAFRALVEHAPPGSRLEVTRNGAPVPLPAGGRLGATTNAETDFAVRPTRGRHVVRVSVRGPSGNLLLIANPIFVDAD